MADPCTKFEVSSTSRCGDFIWGVKFSNGSPDPDHAPFRENFSSTGWNLPQSFLTTLIYDYRIEFQKLSSWSHERRISATFSQRMLRNSYLQTSGKCLTPPFESPTPISLRSAGVRNWRRCPLNFAFMCWKSAIFLLYPCMTYWPRKFITHVDPYRDNFHQVWSLYDHTLPSYSVVAADTWRNFLTLNSWRSWRVKRRTVPPSLTILRIFLFELNMIYKVFHWIPLKMRMRPLWITWPITGGSITITFLESPTPTCLFTIQLLLGYDDN